VLNLIPNLNIDRDGVVIQTKSGQCLHVLADAGTCIVHGDGVRYRFAPGEAFEIGYALLQTSAQAFAQKIFDGAVDWEGTGRGKVSLTGEFRHDRTKLEASLAAMGLQVSNRIDADTALVCGKLPEEGTDKLRYARECGAQILTEMDLVAFLFYGGLEEAIHRLDQLDK
jgi:hypothetical protein